MTTDIPAHSAGAAAQIDIPSVSRFWRAQSDHVQLTLLVAIFAVMWTATLVLTSASPPGDNIEQMLWMQSLQWGYYKHPPLPTWLFWIPAQLFGREVATTYLAAALANLASIAIFWQLMRRLRGSRFAFIAVLAALCISYYNARFTTYNHNTVLMLVSTASAALCWQACTTGRLHWWLGLGVTLGLGLLTKYQIAVTMATVLVFWLYQGGWKQLALRRGMLLASLVALLMFVPHVQWLRNHDFGPIGYAIDSSLGASLAGSDRLLDVLNWLADQLLNRALPAWLLLIAVVAWHWRTNRVGDRAIPATETIERGRHRDTSRAFLLIWGLVPLIFMPLVGLFAGSHLHLPWGTAFLLFAVPMVMEWFGSRIHWNAISRASVTGIFVAVQAASLLLNIATSAVGPQDMRSQNWSNFDIASMARQLEPGLRNALVGNVVAAIDGPDTIAGILALQLPGSPVVLLDGRLDHSPWASPTVLTSGPTLHIRVDEPIAGGRPVSSTFPDIRWWLSWPARTVADRHSTAPPAVAMRD